MACGTTQTRDYSLDNIRFFLIFSVVFAHLLEICKPFIGSELIYKCIYTFHMPAFIFLFGYNFKYLPQRIIYRWFFSYVVFQTIYIISNKIILNSNISLQYTTPYWLLWYILACILYQLVFPIFDTVNPRKQFVFLAVTICAALLIGLDDTVGYYLSLSRFFVFLPYFLSGHYCQKNDLLKTISTHKKIRSSMVLSALAVIVISVPLLLFANIPKGLLYGSYSYAACKGAMWMRALIYAISLSWIVFLFVGAKPHIDKRIFLVTTIGQNTWSIFLLHGFVIKAVPKLCPVFISSPWRVLLLSFLILAFFGNKIMNRVVHYVCFSWVEKFVHRNK